ncbi:MAG: threonine--tRNA ligase, partial [Boseongicola sp.]|nr:threonine--tRNA ligase [Boseongicola sp.]
LLCLMDQIESETARYIDFLANIYADLGFPEFKVNFADRPEIRAGSDETWDKAEEALLHATRAAGIEPDLNPGEGAFYGPKLEFVLTDAIGRDWQCGTHQVDFVLPERLNATYVGEDGDRHRPVMLHRAALGSFERFIGILIESSEGRLPFWLAPRQVVVASITSASNEHAAKIVAELVNAGVRAESDIRNEKISYKVREHSVGKVPMILAVGQREVDDGTVSIRRLGSKATETRALADAVRELATEALPPDIRRDGRVPYGLGVA